MSELLPSIEAEQIRDGLLDYLTTTFALAEPEAQTVLREFLEDPEDGIFRGPYVRLRLPFRAADPGWESALEWQPPFPPYGHQARAFERLSSLVKPPQATLVTTGTGSGKTEAFLYPIFDHVLRAKRDGVEGVKALILYPMNALANDQARRIAQAITTDPSLASIRAALFTGQDGPERSAVSADGLITSRAAIRAQAPDILLTNYKMLDQLLLRPTDAPIWDQSAASLQYLVLDEFHTYDGAQGTDVAMLLRRLGLALKARWKDGQFDDAARQRPLGVITPVATSATLGDGSDPSAMVEFANTVFGGGFDASSVITETRQTVDEWASESVALTAAYGFAPVPVTDLQSAPLVKWLEESRERDPQAIAQRVIEWLYVPIDDDQRADALKHEFGTAAGPKDSMALMDRLLRAHPFVRAVVETAAQAVSVSALAATVFPAELAAGQNVASRDADRDRLLRSLLATLSHVRKEISRDAASVDLHLWVRALTRIDRAAQPLPEFRWSDDGESAAPGDLEGLAVAPSPAFPAVYCRHCGRSGWGVELSTTGNDLSQSDDAIRRNRAAAGSKTRFRALIHAPREGDLVTEDDDPAEQALWWLRVEDRQVTIERPSADDDVTALPVLMLAGHEADKLSADDQCPNCGKQDGIRFLGSAIATQLSVVVTTLFGDRDLDAGEKKALVFTDSVQDAAHRAGFIQSRAHVFNLRNAVRRVVDGETTLDAIPIAMMSAAKSESDRYRLLPPDLVDRSGFRSYWDPPKSSGPSATVQARVRRRLAFDLALEFGLQSRVGRTLEETGSLSVHVEAGPASRLEAIGRAAIEGYEVPWQLDDDRGGAVEGSALVTWVRGTLERLRERGAIEHEWLRKYVEEDGNRFRVWGGRPRQDGMPAFPKGREAPAFARIGKKSESNRESNLDTVSSVQSWYARWTHRCLGVSPHDGSMLIAQLLSELDRVGVIASWPVGLGGAKAYGLLSSSIVIGPVFDDGIVDGRNALVCDTCETTTPGAEVTVDQLDGAPCTTARCPGSLHRTALPARNFYRDQYNGGEMRRVIAREHTGLLEDKLRLEYENEFKSLTPKPDAPNVLVATPTLEMGIDIGDLSTVFLAGLPPTVSSYLQRIGRAGRLTGNALVMAFVLGRGEQLPKIGDPLSVINGAVRPPATYLNAIEILQRQYTAFVIDRLAARNDLPPVQLAPSALESSKSGSFLDAVITSAEIEASELLDTFISAFDGLTSEIADTLRAWASPLPGETRSSSLARTLLTASQEWNLELDRLRIRADQIEASIPALEKAAETGESDDVTALRAARASLRLTRGQITRERQDFWVGALERAGVLPNYTLLDDRVELDVGLSWIDPETGEYAAEQRVYERGRSVAISEFAPGARFYAQGLEIAIDAIDLGSDGERVRTMVFCPDCGFAEEVGDTNRTTCPRCSSTAIADISQRYRVVEIEHVSAEVRRDESTIGDSRDDRDRTRFTVQLAADIDSDRLSNQWYVEKTGFGCKFARSMTLRWVNLGRTGTGPSQIIAGDDHSAPLFRVCRGCGKLDREGNANSASEHRAWCPFRRSTKEHTETVALTRTLTTQAIVLRLPPSMTVGDALAMPSISAAIQLGLREVIGGDPDHLQISSCVEPVIGSDVNNSALLIHDTVPGGTGYLADLADQSRIREVLEKAYQALEQCRCATDPSRAACDQCLLPFAPGGRADAVARSSAVRSLEILLQFEDGAATAWDWTVVDPGVQDPESHLEQWFRKLFKERVDALGAAVKEIPGEWGSTIQASLPGQRRIWSLRPQQFVAGTRPDFILEATGSAIPPIAIYTDGYAFHASPQHLRVADDADKRQALRDLGYRVFAITWDDLRRARDGEPEPFQSWFDSEAMKDTPVVKMYSLGHDALNLITSNPMTALMQWLQNPEETASGSERLASALPFLASPHATYVSERGSIVEQALTLMLGSTDAQPRGQSWFVKSPHLGLLSRYEAGSPSARAVLLLDDTPAAVGAVDYREAWQQWLRFSNLLGPRLINRATIGTTGFLPDVQNALSVSDDVDASGTWGDLITVADPADVALLETLAQRDVPRPELGFEVDGIPLAIAWPDARVAVRTGLTEEEAAALSWTLVASDADEIIEALTRAENQED